MQPITYSLNGTNGDVRQFYSLLGCTTDAILSKVHSYLHFEIEDYHNYIARHRIEEARSFNEYALEAIMIGVYWRCYEVNAIKTPGWATQFLSGLYMLRKRSRMLKPSIDRIRGLLTARLLYHETDILRLEFTCSSLERLIRWLSATGEYNEEVRRLRNWLGYAQSLDPSALDHFLKKLYQFSVYFETTCAKALGEYTGNVSRFIRQARTQYRNREDFGLANRREVEYHLNMVGAEILNRTLRAGFVRSRRKVLLLPTCMRAKSDSECSARANGLERKCVACSRECNIGKTTTDLRSCNVDVYIIPHSSDFTRFLKKWKDVPDVALIGVACVLNLLLGGYEMLNLGIPSQCVFLNQCGCRKHWDSQGMPTTISIDQLMEIIGEPESKPNQYDVTSEGEVIAVA